MGRSPIGTKAMTAAERQRRRRKRLRKEKLKLGRKAERERRLLKAAEAYIPVPPGITYWRQVPVQTAAGEREIWASTTRPLSAVHWGHLSGADLDALGDHLRREVERRWTGRGPGGGGGVAVYGVDNDRDPNLGR
jgi:hypothetical protein